MSMDLKERIIKEFDFTHIALVVSLMVSFFSFVVLLNIYFTFREYIDDIEHMSSQISKGDRFTMDDGLELCKLEGTDTISFCKQH